MERLAPWVFVCLWSTGFIGARYALPYADPFLLLSLRMLFALIALCFIALWLRAPGLHRDDIFHQLGIGVLVHGVYLGGVFYAIDQGTGAGVVALILGAQPLATALWGYFLLSETLSRRAVLGLFLGLMGVAGVIWVKFDTSTSLSTGLVPVLAALGGISLGLVYQGAKGGGVNLISATAWQYVGSLCVFVPLCVYRGDPWLSPELPLTLALLWLVLGLSVGAVLLLLYMINQGQAGHVSSLFYLVPPATAFQAWVLFDEQLPPLAIAATLVVCAGVYLTRSPPRQKALR